MVQGDLVFVKALLIKGFEVRDKVRNYLKQVGTRRVTEFYVASCTHTPPVQGGQEKDIDQFPKKISYSHTR